MNRNKIEGAIGENMAVNYLENKGFRILKQNYKNKIGEIDLIAKDGNSIVFIEVKRRTSAKFGLPREAVTPYKQRQIRTIALSYLKQNKCLNASCRFDVIDILNDEITHIPNAF